MGDNPVALDFTKAVPITSSQSTPSSGVSLDFDQAQHLTDQPDSKPYPIADDQKGVAAQGGSVLKGILNLPSNIWNAFTAPPQNEREQEVLKQAKDADFLFHTGHANGAVRLAIHRLVSAPMEKEARIADAYQTIYDSLPPDQQEKEKDFGNTDSTLHKANLHRIASIAPLLGPMAADITEHYLQGDKSGAVTALLANIAAGKALDSATKGVARQISKVAPRTVTVAGETTPAMAGQLKDAAPIAEQVAKTPSFKIAAEQQAAAQQGVKNIATDAANKTLKKFGESTDEASSFGDASEKVKQAAQPVFKKLDELSEGMFSTYQNKLAAATKVMRKATSMEDLEKAETQFTEAQKGIDDLFKYHADEIGPEDLANAKSAWRDQAVLKKIHSYVESSFSAPEEIADGSSTVTRTLRGNSLRPRLNQMLRKVPSADLERVLGADGVKNLYEIAKLTEKPEGLSEMQSMIGKIASEGYLTRIIKSPIEARNLVARYLATSPRVSHIAISALKFGTPAKVYGPIIANAIAEREGHKEEPGQNEEE